MANWEDMTSEERLEWLWHRDQSMSARLDEVAGVVIELEKQIKGLQSEIARRKGQTRPTIRT